MIRNPRLAAGAASAALAISALGISAGSASAATKHATTTHHHSLVGTVGGITGGVLGGVSSTVSSLTGSSGLVGTVVSELHFSTATQTAMTRDMKSFAASGGGYKGLGDLLMDLSEAPGVSGSQFGEDLQTLAVDMSNESSTSWNNFVDGANKLAQESSSFPAPFNVLFYNLSQGLLKFYYTQQG